MSSPGEQAARRSLLFLWWVPAEPDRRVLGGQLAPQRILAAVQVVPLAVLLAVPFGFGASHGLRAVRLSERRGWIGLVLHGALMLIPLIMPVTEALTRI